MKWLLLVVFLAALILTGCGGGSIGNANPHNPPAPGQPLDPQGNWLFTFYGSSTEDVQLQFAGQLFELHPPVTTGNSMGTAAFGYLCGGMTPSGVASGTDSITMTVVQTDKPSHPPFMLTGTIAPDEEHMSGTWNNPYNGCTLANSGTWTARKLTPVDGTWTGTADNGLMISATLRENTDQTSPDMGHLSGSITVTGGGCFTGPLNLAPEYYKNVHAGEFLLLGSVPDSNGATIQNEWNVTLNVDPDATHAKDMLFNIVGGPCDGQRFTADLQKQ